MSHNQPDLDRLQRRISYRFEDISLLGQALTHSSAKRKRSTTKGPSSKQSYERLEFLGDRVLGLVVAHMLFTAFPGEPEGHLAKRHALLVSKPVLAAIARELDLHQFMMVSVTEREYGGLQNDGLLSDVVEAIIAAMYLDAQSLEPASRFVQAHWRPKIAENKRPPRDPKTVLQEWSQGRMRILPVYDLVEHSGPSHKPIFTVKVSVEGYEPSLGQGANKREAEQSAAKSLIDALVEQAVMTKKDR